MSIDLATSAKNILVVAPHPDDESLGCGGLIATLAAKQRNFHTVFVTDGGASHPGSRTWPRNRLAAHRELEAAEALCRLGIGQQPRTFFRLRDADMPPPSSPEWHAALNAVIFLVSTFRPDLALLPWRRDPHRDHRDSWLLFTEAFARISASPTILEYAIWLEEFGQEADYPRSDEVETLAFDISPVIAKKRAAVAAHVSQTGDLIDDDPSGFRLQTATLDRLIGPSETYFRGTR